MQENEGTGRRQ